MTATLTNLILQTIASNKYGALTTGLGAVVVVVLLVLLIERSLMEAYGGSRQARRGRAFNSAVVPLFIVFGLIALLRMAQLLHVF